MELPVLITEQLIQACLSVCNNIANGIPTSDESGDKESHALGLCNNEHHVKELLNLDLSFQSIDRLGNLSGFGNIVNLSLNNNNISKIIGLDELVQLEMLDLSFNRIQKIEGLSKLTHLSILSLYHNEIEKISGLDQCHELYSLSLGRNNITMLDSLRRLSHLRKLQDLVLMENQISQEKSQYRGQIFESLPWLKYLDNIKVIDEEDKQIVRKEDNCTVVNNHRLIGPFDEEKDDLHELEQIVIIDLSMVSNLGINTEAEIRNLLDSCRKYLVRVLDCNDTFTKQLHILKEKIHLSSHDAVAKMVEIQKQQVSSKKHKNIEIISERCPMLDNSSIMMDTEIELSLEVESMVKDFKTIWLDMTLGNARQESKDKTIHSFKKELLHLQQSLTTSNNEPCNFCIHELETKLVAKVLEIETKDLEEYASILNSCYHEFLQQHRLRVREINS